MDARVCVSVSVRVRARAGDTARLGARAADPGHAVLDLKKGIPFLGARLQS